MIFRSGEKPDTGYNKGGIMRARSEGTYGVPIGPGEGGDVGDTTKEVITHSQERVIGDGGVLDGSTTHQQQ